MSIQKGQTQSKIMKKRICQKQHQTFNLFLPKKFYLQKSSLMLIFHGKLKSSLKKNELKKCTANFCWKIHTQKKKLEEANSLTNLSET